MTEFKIVGISEKQGTYQDKPYHNLVLYCTSSPTNNNTLGVQGDKFKMKWENVAQAFHIQRPSFTLNDFMHLVGKTAYIYFDRYGTASEVKVIKEDNKTA